MCYYVLLWPILLVNLVRNWVFNKAEIKSSHVWPAKIKIDRSIKSKDNYKCQKYFNMLEFSCYTILMLGVIRYFCDNL